MKQGIILAVVVVLIIATIIGVSIWKKKDVTTVPLPRVSMECNGAKCLK